MISGHMGLVRAVAIDQQNDLLISGSYDCSVRLWDLQTHRQLRKVFIGPDSSNLVLGVAAERGRIAL
jgi:WD40 repeat protein